MCGTRGRIGCCAVSVLFNIVHGRERAGLRPNLQGVVG